MYDIMIIDDKPRENCGIVGIYGHSEAAQLAYLSLYALQHRGQESAGIVSSDGENVYRVAGMGLVNDVFADVQKLKRLKGNIAIGHNRYSTAGASQPMNVQPLLVRCKEGPLGIAHNGNLVNYRQIRRQLEAKGSIFQTTSDSEVILHLTARSPAPTIEQRLLDALSQVRGAYSLVFITLNKLIIARDPHGVRPLSLGRLGDAWIAASESCAMDLLGAKYLRDVEPGEFLAINNEGLTSYRIGEVVQPAHCIFELVYFSRPDSRVCGECVDKARRKMGKNLALEHPADADIVISVPDSSNTAAIGYSRRSNIKFDIGLIRNHYIGRTFIQPIQSIRDFNVRVKFNPVEGVLKGRRIVIVEDSIVRGTTLKHLTRMLRKAGAKEVHIRVSSPPIRFPCFYGMDFPTKDEVIASHNSVEQIRRYLEVDSLGYLSLEGLLASVPNEGRGYCTACFNGEYPIPIDEKVEKLDIEKEVKTVEL
ncbi:amidophosphoribosyltransferase [candidate division KSB1 bacterium 4484_219]|nr:amidophosphoribosyltransferase [bacterium]OQX57940.1 MAG: amidophosphoribosyltransferase [candidate division KSB1 bacterium 4484_219]RKY88212.1 MAG: amidophosphoribosyltransferase [candidate division KSB1 bacterium]HDI51663.1 amidophosphoribosyltransferase [Bacteroidota bacterium]